MSLRQTTLADTVSYKGVGLHLGKETVVSFEPAPADTGIVFVRRDLPGSPRVKVSCKT
ncbi:UDP-3-O-acyl-N-acetylglucosamine deacetylase, partial [Candidatus Fermentibacterales bacterium]|nr:UDP-3-O-acyl-N-acetylglucosamine deacetylase [Candidatus Fermentibacterales bacterium]